MYLLCRLHTCLQSPFSQQRPVFQMSCLLAPRPPGEGSKSFPEATRSLGLAVPGTKNIRNSRLLRGTFRPPCRSVGRVFPECLWGFVFFLVAVYVNLAVCSCSSS